MDVRERYYIDRAEAGAGQENDGPLQTSLNT